MTFGVVIPYFQRTPGLLARAVRSALDQTGVETPLIVVVDDGSPHPARLEIESFSEAERKTIVLIEQRNGGVSVARNRAIDAMPETVDIIAFLDPDDAWHTGHLANGNIALGRGAALYFTDYIRPGATRSTFELGGMKLEQHIPIPSGASLYEYNKNVRKDLIQKTIVGTSTVVLQRTALGSVRFRPELTAGEDLLTWFSLTKKNAKIVFSARLEVDYGEGVGLITKAVWGSKRSLRVALDHSIMLRTVLGDSETDNELRSWIVLSRQDCRLNFVRTMLHRLRRLQSIDISSTLRFIKLDPEILVDFFRVLVGLSKP